MLDQNIYDNSRVPNNMVADNNCLATAIVELMLDQIILLMVIFVFTVILMLIMLGIRLLNLLTIIANNGFACS